MASAAGECPERGYPDLHDHLERLEREGLLVRVRRPIDKDTELHPLLRWQFRGGIGAQDRRAFLFENVVAAGGRRYDMPVAAGVLASNRRIYSLGIGCELEDVRRRWAEALAHPIAPVVIPGDLAPVQEMVAAGADLDLAGRGVDGLPVPISTPGWDNAPFFTAAHFITRDPDSGVHNVGNYRSMVKGPRRVGMNCSIELGQGIYQHWLKYRARGEAMPAAICVGGPPCICYVATQKIPYDVSEFDVAGGLVGAPIRLTAARTVPLLVPADGEIVIEGYISTRWLEPEGPFGESHGHMNPKEYNCFLDVTAVTRRRDAILVSLVSQLAPSEASVMGRAAEEVQYLDHLRQHCGLRSVTRVVLHEPLVNRQKLIAVQFQPHPPAADVWRALMAAASCRPSYGKLVVAVDEDIDPDNAEALFWAMGYRSRPWMDVQIVRGAAVGHSPRVGDDPRAAADAWVLWDATLKEAYPPVSLPKREYMERAAEIWSELGLPPLRPEMPWYGYSLGLWNDDLEREAALAAAGESFRTGEAMARQRVSTDEVQMNSRFVDQP